MAPPYLSTHTYNYLAPPTNSSERVKLKNKRIIIDANSFLYYIYDHVLREEDRKNFNQDSLTNTLFMKNVYWQEIKNFFSNLKRSCEVMIVFDGIFKSHKDKRPDPQRYSTDRCVALQQENRLPVLLHEQFIRIAREFKMDVLVARGEADPMVASLAKERDAYVVAADADYHLYDLPKGYIPLRYLNRDTLSGHLYHMKDVFPGLNASDVGLFAAVVAYDYITFEAVQELLSKVKAKDKEEFRNWVENSGSDALKRKWLFTQWITLRFIQQYGGSKAHKLFIELVEPDKRDCFNRIISKYTTATPMDVINTRNRNPLHRYLDHLFISGDLDRAIIDIVISKEVLIRDKVHNMVFFQMLLPIVLILYRSDSPTTTDGTTAATITYQKITYELSSMNQTNVQLPSLDDIAKMSVKDRANRFLYCIQEGFQNVSSSSQQINTDQVDCSHVFWLCFVKLWYHTGNVTNEWKQPIRFAIIVSYFMKTLLDESERSDNDLTSEISAISAAAPLLKSSRKILKNLFSKDTATSLNKRVQSKCKFIQDEDQVKTVLLELEQFYRVISMINKFFNCPFEMPMPCECINEYCSPLAVIISQKKNQENFVRTGLFKENEILNGLLMEILSFIDN